MFPTSRLKRQPRIWQMTGEPPPWIWMVPTASASGLVRIAAVPPPVLFASASPPHLFQSISGWQVPCDPFLPVMSMPSLPEPAIHQLSLPNVQWLITTRPPFNGYPPAGSMDLVPVLPHAHTSGILPPHFLKGWAEKRPPNYKVFVNNIFTLDSSWLHPEDTVFHGHEKPLLLTNPVAVSVTKPSAVSRPLHAVLLTQTPTAVGRPNGLKPVSSYQKLALAAASTTAVAPSLTVPLESSQGPYVTSPHPCHFFTLSPVKIPFLTSPFPAHEEWIRNRVAQRRRERRLAGQHDKSIKVSGPCTSTLILHTERGKTTSDHRDKDIKLKISSNEEKSNDNKPVASTPVPGSPWCVVWTGDDRVFFFNPTMQLSVWEKPVDLKGRGDINKIIEDPPHKRKMETSSTNKSDISSQEDTDEEQRAKIKRNKTDALEKNEEKDTLEKSIKENQQQTMLPLEVRITHFRDMLLERGVSAFSTWEKELHKTVFDPRYLLLSSDERKQVFEQFVKTRIREEYKEKRSKLLQAKEEFRKLLEEAKLSPRTTFKDFAEKYGRDQRFRLVQKRKDQEHFFNQFMHILKKRDKENRIRLRKMR
ncbi:transcription elongation regulator 1-like protein [Protopterus annectens]|uniref:transcription elongation regulator 1-like protein n=1 Tax=Protopterus annectens TaxID=7888 RepID=UPI001CFC27E4|nr:transcription elongation regulator 1-like protein [Protopterus annectens]